MKLYLSLAVIALGIFLLASPQILLGNDSQNQYIKTIQENHFIVGGLFLALVYFLFSSKEVPESISETMQSSSVAPSTPPLSSSSSASQLVTSVDMSSKIS